MFISLFTLLSLVQFVDCMNGPRSINVVVPVSECLNAFDFDGDVDIDLRDFGFLQNNTHCVCD